MRRVTELPPIGERDPQGHKGTYGRVLIVAGSRGMSGAGALSGQGALRSGAGLVTVACPDVVAPIVAGVDPCYLTLWLPSDRQGRVTAQAYDKLRGRKDDVIAVGPGMGASPALRRLVLSLLAHASAPLVIDADGLNVLAGHIEPLAGRAAATILTPHPGEFSRLTGRSIAAIQADREEMAARFAKEHGVVLVLKGPGTVITDGTSLAVNDTGNPGMGTGGSGDVLTGIIAALLGQGFEPFDAARLGVYLHGRAGDLAAEDIGMISMTPVDLLAWLPQAFLELATP
ncbi:NAD(P)H-hydrate dehydratase [Planctomycetes bacterium Pan216]